MNYWNSKLRDALIDSMNRDRDWLEYWMDMELNRPVGMELYEGLKRAWLEGYTLGKEFK